ncbi:hypothetical protein Phum_PHUM191180 [Pediculus humanus corporis]|uniref:Uncharacterized protein n=1 Tax=Pediculus humanus subsp. corporis TaxID=121224 RepID=E0VGR3_PEDHC|nr:uncharacterized protein Phum_PHUM191180 [Pediculus humanus corporis]EEB12569.1 hypothetical protein Phum_PHUM191180 [Pediculus humanus corporis]
MSDFKKGKRHFITSCGGGQNVHENSPNMIQKDYKMTTLPSTMTSNNDTMSHQQQKMATQEGGTPLLLLNLPQEIFQEVQKIAQAGTPGVTTTRIIDPDSKDQQIINLYREIETEAGFVCKKCRMAYQTEIGLLTHQRNICYPGKLSESRGSVRLVTILYECKLCSPSFVCPTANDFKRHCETEVHVCKVNQQQQQQQQRLLKPGFPNQIPPSSPSSGLTHEMENVVNQITALAAQAAQESSPPTQSGQDSNANFTMKNSKEFCQPKTNKINLINTHVPIHSSGH